MTAFVARGHEAGIGMPLPITKHVLLQATMAMKLLTLGGAYTCSRPRNSRQQQQKKDIMACQSWQWRIWLYRAGERMSRESWVRITYRKWHGTNWSGNLEGTTSSDNIPFTEWGWGSFSFLSFFVCVLCATGIFWQFQSHRPPIEWREFCNAFSF